MALLMVLPATALHASSVSSKNVDATKPAATAATSKTPAVSESPTAKKKMAAHRRHRRRYAEHFYTNSYADNQTEGDQIVGEDPIVRQAAIDALGNMNGTVVAIDPATGRVLAMVNQKLALSQGAEPCSTIKVPVALAALSEGVINTDTLVRVSRRTTMNLSQALAVSNNAYFEAVGRRLGFEKVAHYAQQFGLGELAGLNIEGEHLGAYPAAALDAKLGGVGKMCSFGESISMTPLQLGALMSAIANGGTLYYLQHPHSVEEAQRFQPVIKRKLDIAPLVPQIAEGMAGAVDYGTARTLHYNFSEEQVLGKTGTCSNNGTRFGWFGSFANTQYGRIVVVVFLQGGRPTFGPKAAEVAGVMYRALYDHSYFAVTKPAVAAAGASQ